MGGKKKKCFGSCVRLGKGERGREKRWTTGDGESLSDKTRDSRCSDGIRFPLSYFLHCALLGGGGRKIWAKRGGGEITIEFWPSPTHTLSPRLLACDVIYRFPPHIATEGGGGKSKSHFPRIFVRSTIVTLGETPTPILKERVGWSSSSSSRGMFMKIYRSKKGREKIFYYKKEEEGSGFEAPPKRPGVSLYEYGQQLSLIWLAYMARSGGLRLWFSPSLPSLFLHPGVDVLRIRARRKPLKGLDAWCKRRTIFIIFIIGECEAPSFVLRFNWGIRFRSCAFTKNALWCIRVCLL